MEAKPDLWKLPELNLRKSKSNRETKPSANQSTGPSPPSQRSPPFAPRVMPRSRSSSFADRVPGFLTWKICSELRRRFSARAPTAPPTKPSSRLEPSLQSSAYGTSPSRKKSSEKKSKPSAPCPTLILFPSSLTTSARTRSSSSTITCPWAASPLFSTVRNRKTRTHHRYIFIIVVTVITFLVVAGSRGSGRSPLHWETRVSVALAAARGIEYIHSMGPNSSHGNIKSSNILLDEPQSARVSDQGLSHLAGPSATPNRLAGYRAPEVTDPRKVSQKADVYSFGVLLLELLTGKAPAQALLNEEGVDLPRWVQSVVREEWTSEVFDSELLRYQSVEEEMIQLLQLAIDCTVQYPDKRPSMAEVVTRIEEIHVSSIGKGGLRLGSSA